MKVNLYKFVFSIIFILSISSIYAQDHTVTGTVKDKNDGLGIPGVNVIEKGTLKGTITDIGSPSSTKSTVIAIIFNYY